MRALGLAVILVLLLASPVLALGILKIEVPSKATVGEEVEIKVVDSLTGEPVEGATVYINGVEIGTTDDDGEISYVFDSPGVYVIGATKFGYTPALEVSLTVESSDSTETSTPESPAPEEPKQIVLEGAVITLDVVSKSFLESVDSELQETYGVTASAFFVNDNVFAVLIGGEFETGSYKITGFEKGYLKVGKNEFLVVAVENFERLEAIRVSFEQLEDETELYVGKEVQVYAYLREFPFMVGTKYFETDIYPGSLTKDGKPPLMDSLKDLLEENEVDYDGLPTIRLTVPYDEYGNKQAFWKGAFATVTGLVVPTVFMYDIVPDTVKRYLPDEDYMILILSASIDAEQTTIREILANPEAYYGKVVEIEATGMGVTQSVKDLLATVFPPAATSPVDVYIVMYALFNLPLDENNVIPAFAISSYDRALGMEIPDGYYRIKGKIMSLKQLDDGLPDEPVLIIFEAERTRIVDILITDDDKSMLQGYIDLLESYVLGEERYKEYEEKAPEHEKPHPEETKTPEEVETPEKIPTPEETPSKSLESLSIEISPSRITANPGDTIKLKLKVDWEPKDWKGNADVKIVLSAAGFKKEYVLPGIVLENPPIESEFSYTLSDNLPPLTYEAKIIVEAEGKKAESSVEITIGTSKTPGFEAVAGLLALGTGLNILQRRRD